MSQMVVKATVEASKTQCLKAFLELQRLPPKHVLPTHNDLQKPSRVAMETAIYRSLHTPEPPNPPKVSKRSSRASPPVPEHWFWHVFGSFSGPLGPFSTLFWHSGRGGPGRLFWDFLGISGARGCGDSCIWRFPSQLATLINLNVALRDGHFSTWFTGLSK